ncbi:hypothetical protein, partial [Burkholderia pseudomallei]|uniref:hypothetical protein n=1 Tax=Burkholderia pseudomallei TaxID=28450 RepID=UPI001F31A3A1
LAIEQFRLLTSIKLGVRLYAIVLQGSTVFCDEPFFIEFHPASDQTLSLVEKLALRMSVLGSRAAMATPMRERPQFSANHRSARLRDGRCTFIPVTEARPTRRAEAGQ